MDHRLVRLARLPLHLQPDHRPAGRFARSQDWRAPTDHTHQVGNDRSSPLSPTTATCKCARTKARQNFSTTIARSSGHFGAGIGFLTDGNEALSTFYSGKVALVRKDLGPGLFPENRKETTLRSRSDYLRSLWRRSRPDFHREVDQSRRRVCRICAGSSIGAPRISILLSLLDAGLPRSTMANAAAVAPRISPNASTHQFKVLPKRRRLDRNAKIPRVDPRKTTQCGRRSKDLKKNPVGQFGGPVSGFSARRGYGRPQSAGHFPSFAGCALRRLPTNAAAFFGTGGVEHPSGICLPACQRSRCQRARPARILLERRSRTAVRRKAARCTFCTDICRKDSNSKRLVAKYSADPASYWPAPCAAWKADGVRFTVPAEPWVERETSWHNYYLRSSMTYDSFFREHILSQGHVYQYSVGFQGAARDPLQHTLPFVFSNPELCGIIRYTLKEIQPDRLVPVCHCGQRRAHAGALHPQRSGNVAAVDRQPNMCWPRATKNFSMRKFQLIRIERSAGDPTVGELLSHSYTHMVKVLGAGKHGLMRLSNGDWNDGVVVGRVRPKFRPRKFANNAKAF